MKLQKLVPWNWFKKEQDEQSGSSIVPSRHPGHPTTAMNKFHDEFDRLFSEFFGRRDWPSADFDHLMPAATEMVLRPTLDISESDNAYTVKVEVPGVGKEDIKVEFVDGTLVVSGEKTQESEEKNKKFHRIERSYGSFRRILDLPPDADSDEVEAKFKRGVLTLTVPKKSHQASKGRVVAIED